MVRLDSEPELARSQFSEEHITSGECPLWVISGHFALRKSCPLYLRNRTWIDDFGMSAKCQKQTSRLPQIMRPPTTELLDFCNRCGGPAANPSI